MFESDNERTSEEESSDFIRGHIIKAARWDIYPNCNLNCLHCCASGLYDHKQSKYLGLKPAIELVDKLWGEGITHLNILGKEPFLHPNIFNILEHACKRGFKVDITTNGTTISEKKIPFLVEVGLQSIFFSIDGSNPKINDAIRGQGVFQKTFQFMKKLLKEKERKNSSLLVNVNTVLNRINARDINNIVDLCSATGVSFFKLSPLLDIGKALENYSHLYLEPREEFEVAEEVITIIPNYVHLQFSILSDQPKILEYFYKKYKVVFPITISGCKGCIKEIYLDATGDISPCLGTSSGFYNFSKGRYYKQYRENIFDFKGRKICEIPFYEEFQSAFPLVKETYNNYIPCNSCPYCATLCFPCPLDFPRKKHREELCLIAEEKLNQLIGGKYEWG